jgi:glycosyltransferase involved in cell wall biosynthesis
VVQRGVNGYCVEPLNPKAFAEAIDTALQGDLESFSQSAYNHVIAYYQWQQICPRYINFLAQVIQSQTIQNASAQ